MTRNLLARNLAVAALFLLMAFAGCAGGTETLRIAYVPTDDQLTDSDPQRIADFIEAHSDLNVELYEVTDVNAALAALASGQADVAFTDAVAGFFGWKEFGLEAVLANVNGDGRAFYTAAAIVTNASITEFSQLRGMTSCHTGLLKSAGMFMPLGWMINEGLVDPRDFADELSSIPALVETFFDDAIIPESTGLYAGYNGALECLSVGAGNVAFVKDITVSDYCGNNPASWCLNESEYHVLQSFGNVPSHPVMASPEIDDEVLLGFLNAMLLMNTDAEGQDILQDVLETGKLTEVDSTEGFLGDFQRNLKDIPGMAQYIDSKLD